MRPSSILYILVCLALAGSALAQNLSGATDEGRDDFRYGGGGRGGGLTIKGLSDLGPGAGDFPLELSLGNDGRTRREAIVEMLREPGLRQKDLDRLRDRRKASLAQTRGNPASIPWRARRPMSSGARGRIR